MNKRKKNSKEEKQEESDEKERKNQKKHSVWQNVCPKIQSQPQKKE